MVIEKKQTAELTPAEYNPRKDLKPGDPEYEKLKRSITEFGYAEPVIWNNIQGMWSGKMSPAHSPQTKGPTSKQSSKRSSASLSRQPRCLLLIMGDGLTQTAAWEPDGAWLVLT